MPQLAKNKKAFFDYEIIEKYEAGMVLYGFEVKSCKNAKVNLKGSYVTDRDGEIYVDNITIGRYEYSSEQSSPSVRRIKLLLKKSQIDKISGFLHTKGLTVIPLTMYTINHKIKLEIGVARGRKKADKRAVIKERDQKRRMASVLKTY